MPEVPLDELVPAGLRRTAPARLPEVSELDLLRHFTHLSTLNFGVESGSYPLGSCTMKYNPKVNEVASRLDGFAGLHPYQPESLVQGALELMYELERWLAEIAGLHATTLQPAAGAHGELTGLLIMRAYHQAQGRDPKRIIIPDTAHGTNPASVMMAGYEPVAVTSDARGGVDLEALKALLDDDLAGLMLTNPNTLGVFDENIAEIARLVHEAGGLLYYDGANSNAVLGISRPGDMGFDVVHFNTHKTFSTPHGGGGPGAGPIVVRDTLAPFLPVPLVGRADDGRFFFDDDRPQSIGKVRTFYGNFGVLVRAYTYIRGLGPEGLRRVSEMAVLNANYVMEGIRDLFDVPFERRCMHEFVASAVAAQGARRARPGRGQAPARLRRAPADDVLPADRRRGAHDRAHRDRVARGPRPPDRGAARRRRRGGEPTRRCCARRRSRCRCGGSTKPKPPVTPCCASASRRTATSCA